MEKDKKRIIAGVVVLCGAGAGLYLLSRRMREEEVPPPPAEGYGRIWGYIKNDQTDERVGGAIVYLDGVQESTTDQNGMYGTSYVPFGSHTVVVEADNYERLEDLIVIEEESEKVEIRLTPISEEAPTEWTEGVEVVKIKVEPTYAYVGEEIEIKVYIQYPDPLPLPAEIHGSVLVNGTLISGAWEIDYRNPNLRLKYVASSPGVFTVRAQDKSAVFQVEAAPAGTFYPPWGGVRMPLCTDIAIPAEPFTLQRGDTIIYDHPGGDLLYSDLYEAHRIPGGSAVTTFTIYYPFDRVPEILSHLAEARPVAWNPPNAVVTEYAITAREESRQYNPAYAMIMAVEYTCQPYWNSLNELAAMLADGLGYSALRFPDEWKRQYGKLCTICGGTGITDKCQYCGGTGVLPTGQTCRHCHGTGRRRGGEGTCWNCGGAGYVLRVDLRRGWRDWVKGMKYGSICGGGMCTPRLYCPYADEHGSGEKDYVAGAPHTRALAWDVESFVRLFLRHIEEKHPNHPLTAQAWV